MSDNRAPGKRSNYLYFSNISTRWMDNDVYGHINNIVYYSFFDTVINSFLIKNNVLNIHTGDVIGLVVETQCNYFAPLSFPEPVSAGLNVEKIGNSSVTYNIGIFGDDNEVAAAQGHFVHVYVNKTSRRPVPVPENLQIVLKSILKKE